MKELYILKEMFKMSKKKTNLELLNEAIGLQLENLNNIEPGR